MTGGAGASDQESGDTRWDYGIRMSAGYFNFRNSLYVDIDPDPPGNLGEDWTEFTVMPWFGFERDTSAGTWFGKVSWAYARTGDDASEISGGHASSTDFDSLYLGWRHGSIDTGQFEVAGGRYPYKLAHGFLLQDGYADGGSRGAIWTNPRTAWAPGGRMQYRLHGHTGEIFYLERDDRPESDADIRLSGVNYEWQSNDQAWTLGAAYMNFRANERRRQLDGADVWNLRIYTRPFSVPLTIEAEWAYEETACCSTPLPGTYSLTGPGKSHPGNLPSTTDTLFSKEITPTHWPMRLSIHFFRLFTTGAAGGRVKLRVNTFSPIPT